MTGTLLATIVGIAALDSINPVLFVALFYLLSTPRPASRVASYIGGVLAVNFAGGLLLLAGALRLISSLLTNLSNNVLYAFGLLLGLTLIGFGLWLKVQASEGDTLRRLRSLQLVHAFLLGAAVMLNEITTALPYFAATRSIVAAQLTPLGNIAAIALYNAVFGLPLFGFLLAFLALRQRFVERLNWMSGSVQLWSLRILKYGSIGFGALLMADAAAFLGTGAPLFGYAGF
jgi:cytochrome c biogenesis protein CcdA